MSLFTLLDKHYLLFREDEKRTLLNSNSIVKGWNKWKAQYNKLSLCAYVLHLREEGFHNDETCFASEDKSGIVEWSNETLANIVIASISSSDYPSVDEYKKYIRSIYTLPRKRLLYLIREIDTKKCMIAYHTKGTYLRPEMALLNGFITTVNRDWIAPKDELMILGLTLVEYITRQDRILTELLDHGCVTRVKGYNVTKHLLFRNPTYEEHIRWQ